MYVSSLGNETIWDSEQCNDWFPDANSYIHSFESTYIKYTLEFKV